MNKKMIVIFDLDGTLANIQKRKELSLKANGKIDWNKFFNPELIKQDLPNLPVLKIAQLLDDSGYTIYIFSGRSRVTQSATIDWLKEHNVSYDLLKMREDKDLRPDEIIKKEFLLESTNPDEVFIVFDDRQKVVDMWRSLGLTCFQVDEGNF